MSGILVIAEHEGGVFKKTAAELLGKATELAGTLGVPVSAAVLGDAPAAELGAFGAASWLEYAEFERRQRNVVGQRKVFQLATKVSRHPEVNF